MKPSVNALPVPRNRETGASSRTAGARRRLPQRGFSLIETLVAISVAAIGLLTVLEIFPIGFEAAAKSQARVTATAVASDIMTQFRRVLQTGPSDSNWGQFAKYNHTYTEKYQNNAAGTGSQLYGISGMTYSADYSTAPTGLNGTVVGNPNFYWKVWLQEVIDPFGKFAPQFYAESPGGQYIMDSTNHVPNIASTLRVSVFVRGPFSAPTGPTSGAGGPGPLQCFNFSATGGNFSGIPGANSGAVEVRLVGYVTNYTLCNTVLKNPAGPYAGNACDGTNTPWNPTPQVPAQYQGAILDLPGPSIAGGTGPSGPDGLTVFNWAGLCTYEWDDTGPPQQFKYSSITYTAGAGTPGMTSSMLPYINNGSNGAYLWGCNELGMDNIWIGDMTDFNYFNNPAHSGDPQGVNRNLKGEGNKVVAVASHDSGGNLYVTAANATGYYVFLAHPIRGLLFPQNPDGTPNCLGGTSGGTNQESNGYTYGPYPTGTAVVGTIGIQSTP